MKLQSLLLLMSPDLQDDVYVMTQLYTLNPAPSETQKHGSKDEQWICTRAVKRNKEWWTQQQTCVYWSRGPPLTVIRRGSPSSSALQRRWCWVTSCWAGPVNLRAPLDSNLSHFCIIDVRNSTFRWLTASMHLMQNITFHATFTQKINAPLRDKEKQLFTFFIFPPSSDQDGNLLFTFFFFYIKMSKFPPCWANKTMMSLTDVLEVLYLQEEKEVNHGTPVWVGCNQLSVKWWSSAGLLILLWWASAGLLLVFGCSLLSWDMPMDWV